MGLQTITKFGNVWAFPPPHYPANARSLRSVTSKRSGWAFSLFSDRSVLSCEMEYVLDPSDFQKVLSDRREAHARLKNLRNLACKRETEEKVIRGLEMGTKVFVRERRRRK
ncbi:hypothetical protein Peur_030237 [Populus x canadensis]